MEFKVKNAEDVEGQKDKIIKEKDVTDAIEESIKTYKDYYIKTVTEQLLKEEMETGGLSPYALCIEGQTPLYDQAVKLSIKANKLTASIDDLQKEIESYYHKQRAIELRKLSKAIDDAIAEHEEKLKNYEALNDAVNGAWDAVDKIKQDLEAQGTPYRETPALGINYGYSSPWSYSTYNSFGQTTVTIQVPGLKRNAYKDKMTAESNEITALKEKQEIINNEASNEESEV